MGGALTKLEKAGKVTPFRTRCCSLARVHGGPRVGGPGAGMARGGPGNRARAPRAIEDGTESPDPEPAGRGRARGPPARQRQSVRDRGRAHRWEALTLSGLGKSGRRGPQGGRLETFLHDLRHSFASVAVAGARLSDHQGAARAFPGPDDQALHAPERGAAPSRVGGGGARSPRRCRGSDRATERGDDAGAAVTGAMLAHLRAGPRTLK